MKKIIATLIALVFLASAAFADRVVPPSALPQAAQEFIAKNFAEATVVHVEADSDDYEVRLSSGVKIEFRLNGEWKEIKSYSGLSLALLPEAVAKTVAEKFPGVAVFKMEKEWGGYEVTLANHLELLIAPNGSLLRQKFDD